MIEFFQWLPILIVWFIVIAAIVVLVLVVKKLRHEAKESKKFLQGGIEQSGTDGKRQKKV